MLEVDRGGTLSFSLDLSAATDAWWAILPVCFTVNIFSSLYDFSALAFAAVANAELNALRARIQATCEH